jgi:hypothetical protein
MSPGWTGPLDGDDAGKAAGKQPRLQREKDHGGTADIPGAPSHEDPPGRERPDDAVDILFPVADEISSWFSLSHRSTGPETEGRQHTQNPFHPVVHDALQPGRPQEALRLFERLDEGR